MATLTAGTIATTTLTAIQWFPGFPGADATHAADFATVALGVARDSGQPLGGPFGVADWFDPTGNKTNQILAGAVTPGGRLTLPGGRGTIQLQPGDWIAVDGFGNLFMIPQRALPKTLQQSCTLSSTSPKVTSTVDLRTLGWQNGMHVRGTHTPTGTVVGDLATDGKSYNMYTFSTGVQVNATGSATETVTGGTFSHS